MKSLAVKGDKRMTVREVAEALGVTPEGIKKHIRELFPELLANGRATYLTEAHVLEIKRRMIPTTEVAGAVTSLEIEEMTIKVLAYHKAEADRLRAELQTAQPKAAVYDLIADATGLKSVRQVADILGIGSVSFFRRLREDGIFFIDDDVNLPRREHIEAGRFVVREEPYERSGQPRVYTRIFVTPKGELWLAAKYGRRV